MNGLRYKLISFMSGRYGSDKLNYFLLSVYFVIWIVNIFIPSQIISLFIDIIQLAVMIVLFFRMFSRNIYKRRKENETFLIITKKILPDFKLIKCKWQDRHTHIYKKCPSCRSVLRLRKISGEHTAVCPKCSNRVNVKIK